MKKIIIVTGFILMIGWALYDFLAPQEKTIVIKDSSAIVDMTANQLTRNSDAEKAVNEEEKNRANETTVGLEIGNMAPDFQLTTLEGEEVSLSDFRGKRVMINFWATWCGPCRVEMPDMEDFYLKNDVIILAINLTETEPSVQQVQDFVDEFYLSFPILLDETITVATEYEIRPIPTSFLVDSNGIIRNKAFGALTYDQMVDEFEKMQ